MRWQLRLLERSVLAEEAREEARRGEQQKEPEGDLEPAPGQPMREAGAEWRDIARDRRDQDHPDHRDEADRQRWQLGLMRQAGEAIAERAGERDRHADAGRGCDRIVDRLAV